jgi:hypothetical protein
MGMVVKDIMKCPKEKNCILCSYFGGRKQFICIGYNRKPEKYKKDIINVCMNGRFTKDFFMQMTPKETLVIGAGLLNAIGIE